MIVQLPSPPFPSKEKKKHQVNRRLAIHGSSLRYRRWSVCISEEVKKKRNLIDQWCGGERERGRIPKKKKKTKNILSLSLARALAFLLLFLSSYRLGKKKIILFVRIKFYSVFIFFLFLLVLCYFL